MSPGPSALSGVDPVAAPAGSAALRVVRRRQPPADLGYEPSLDGLRAVAVLAVCLYHARFPWIPGGFLGVSTFFTLSGFLITTLLLAEWRRSGGLDLRRFTTRRFRRLLPAAWMTLLVVLAMGALGVWDGSQLRSLRGDVPAALAEVSNWWFILQDRSYGALFEAPSPTEHFWSLAVEQQFYLVFPALLLGVLVGARRLRRIDPVRILVGVLAMLAVASAWWNWRSAQSSIPRAYFGTDTRLAELVAGALLATVGVQRLRTRSARVGALIRSLGVLGLIGTLVLWNRAEVSSGWMYPLGFLVTAGCSVAIIAASMRTGLLRSALGLRPLVALGRISYGVYLLHWPVFLWLTPTRTGWAPWPLFLLRMAVTIGAAVVMYRLLERPVRDGGGLAARWAPRAAVPLAVVVLLSTVLVTRDAPPATSLEAAAAATTTLPPPAPLRTLVIGDETAAAWGPASTGTVDDPLAPSTLAIPGCGLVALGFVAMPDGTAERNTDRCGDARAQWVAAVEAQRPELVLVSGGLRDVADRRVEADTPWRSIGDPALDDLLALELRELLGDLVQTGVPVAVATVPAVQNSTLPPPAPPPRGLPEGERERELYLASMSSAVSGGPGPGFPENDPARIARWNVLLREAAGALDIPVVDVAAATDAWPGGSFDPALRAPDGVGFTAAGQGAISSALAPALRDARPPIPAPDPVAGLAASVPLPPAPPVTPRRTVAAGAPAGVLVVGDSVALDVGLGLRDTDDDGALLDVALGAKLGCPIARGGEYKFLRDVIRFEDECDWATFFPGLLESYDPTVVVLGTGIWEVVDRRLPGDDRLRSIGEPTSDRYFLAELLSAIDVLASRGATVVLLTYPHIESGRGQGFTGLPESDPARIDRLNELILEAASLRPGVATVVDFGAFVAAQPGGELDPSIRSDGVHLTEEFIPVVGNWLAPQVDAIARNGPPAA